jgi:hypothetical protein
LGDILYHSKNIKPEGVFFFLKVPSLFQGIQHRGMHSYSPYAVNCMLHTGYDDDSVVSGQKLL